MMPEVIDGGATFSECGRFRYELRRVWDRALPALAVIGLNPSTADATTDDPTMRRVRGFAADNGFGSFIMLNLFAYRATKPRDLNAAGYPTGDPENIDRITEVSNENATLVAWGGHQGINRRVLRVTARLRGPLLCLGVTQGGMPRHPLYLPAETQLQVWREFRDV